MKKTLLLAGTITLIALSAVGILVLLGWQIGVGAAVVGLAAAVVPVPLIVLAFLWLGRYEPEPVSYLVFCFTWGAFVATLGAFGANTGIAVLFDLWGVPEALLPPLVAPVTEETLKFAAPVLLWLRKGRAAVTGLTKGIVYAGLSATGFAMVENILYLGGLGFGPGVEEFGIYSGLMGLFLVFIVRIVMSAFAHPLFTVAAGIGLGLAVRSRRLVRVLWLLGGLAVAMLLHGAWNAMAVLSAETGQPLFFLYGYAGVMLPLFLAAAGLAIWLRSREGKQTQRRLPDYARAGWLSPPEVASLATLASRHSARQWARRVAGEPGVRAMRGFQRTATRLAVLRDQQLRDQRLAGEWQGPDPAAVAQELALLAEIGAHRAGYVGRDPQVPPARWNGQSYELAFPDGTWWTVPAPPEPAMPIPVPLPGPGPPPPGYR